jgi:LacI family transcriptional regulator
LDNVAAGRAAGELLHGARRRRWVVIRDEMVWDAIRLREEGAVSVARDVGAHVDVLVTPAGMGELRTREWLVPRLKKLKPDGVYAAAAVHSVAALLACIKAGLRVPDKLSLVGCDASLWKGPGCPSITSVDVSWYTAGDLAVRKMAELSRTGEAVFPSIRLLPQVRKGETCPGGEEESAQVTVT